MREREEQESGRGQGGEIPASEKSEAFIKRHKRKQQTTATATATAASAKELQKLTKTTTMEQGRNGIQKRKNSRKYKRRARQDAMPNDVTKVQEESAKHKDERDEEKNKKREKRKIGRYWVVLNSV